MVERITVARPALDGIKLGAVVGLLMWLVILGGIAHARHHKKKPTPTPTPSPSVRLENPRDVQDMNDCARPGAWCGPMQQRAEAKNIE